MFGHIIVSPVVNSLKEDGFSWMKWHWLPMWRMLGMTGRINFEYHPFGIKTTCADSDGEDDVV